MNAPVEIDCLLLADDLTGSCDAAVHFAARGRTSTAMIGSEITPCDARVIAINTESRDLDAVATRAAIFTASRQPDLAPRIVFKKIDSTLRGRPGVEIAAALEAFDCRAAVVCPAFPRMKRLVKAGFLHVSGAADFAPVEVAAHFHGQSGCTQVRADAIASAVDGGARVLLLDAVCDGDLDEIASAVLALDGRTLWAGSGGLAAALARGLPPGADSTARPKMRGPVLLAIGSNHAVTLRQQAALVAERDALLLDAERTSARRLHEALDAGRHVMLRIPRGRMSEAQVREIVAGASVGALALSGGDTASHFLRAAGAQRIDLVEEIVAGIPYGIVRGGSFDGIAAATKSGGFGEVNDLIQVVDYFTCPNR